MEIVLWALFFILIAIAFVGSFVHRFPGPILALIAILMAKFCMKAGELISWGSIVIIILMVAACYILNKQLPKLTKKLGDYGKGGNWGALVGSLLALLILPICSGLNQYVSLIILIVLMIVLPFLFATLFEYSSQKDWNKAMVSARSATITYVCSTVLKLVTVVYSVYIMFTV